MLFVCPSFRNAVATDILLVEELDFTFGEFVAVIEVEQDVFFLVGI